MRELVKERFEKAFGEKDLAAALLYHIISGVLGFICSRAVVMEAFLPFGISFVAGVPVSLLPSVAIGAFFGYFFPVIEGGAFRYLASLFAILAIKLLLGSFKKIVTNPVFLSLITMLCVFFTSAVTFDGVPTNVMHRIAEAVLSSFGAYFICRAYKAMDKSSPGLTGEELTCVFLTFGIIVCSLEGVNIIGISLGKITGIILLLLAAKFGGVLSGSVGGITLAFVSVLTGGSACVCVGYAFGGMMAGVFSSYSKYVQIAATIGSFALSLIVGGEFYNLATTLTECTVASGVFMAVPLSVGAKIGKIFSSYPKVSVPTGLKKSVIMRLLVASNALKDVSSTVDKVSSELSKINTPDFSEVLYGIEQDACAGCKLRTHCWDTKKNETVAAVLEMTKAVKRGMLTPETFTTEEFKNRCIRTSNVSAAVYKRYSEYASRTSAESRIEEVRSVISDQFDGISAMLTDLAIDFEKDEIFDNSAALKASAALKNIDISVDECSSRIDKFGRMTLELKINKRPETAINKLQMMKIVSAICERDFDVPSVNEVGGDYFITFTEHAQYQVDVGVSQINAGNSKMCGDAYSYFYDSRGNFISVLSDGMGTGGRAAVDGAMASGLMSRLLKAGFGYDCSLKILNSSMLFKSTDESLATVDVACLDLYTGKLNLLKAGAAPTVVMRSGRTGKAESSSLPAGILRNIGFDKASLKMKEGDIVIMMSDGAASEGTDWIREELEKFEGGRAQRLAEHLCRCAQRRRNGAHEDDITVIAIIIEKA